jgi:hypothetical protein
VALRDGFGILKLFGKVCGSSANIPVCAFIWLVLWLTTAERESPLYENYNSINFAVCSHLRIATAADLMLIFYTLGNSLTEIRERPR